MNSVIRWVATVGISAALIAAGFAAARWSGKPNAAAPPSPHEPINLTGAPMRGSNGDQPASVAESSDESGKPRRANADAIPAPLPTLLKGDAQAEMARDESVAPVDERGGAFKQVTFAKLAGFTYDIDEVESSLRTSEDGKPMDVVPADVRALNGRKVVIRGFMVPIEIRRNEATSFLLVRNRLACCFGMLLTVNEWVHVRMNEGKTARYLNDTPVAIYGTLEVGEDIRDGMVMSLYRLKGEDVQHFGGY